MYFSLILTANFKRQLSAFFSENFWCLCLLITIPSTYHITANEYGFPYLKKSKGKHKVATRIWNKSWADDQSLEEALRHLWCCQNWK